MVRRAISNPKMEICFHLVSWVGTSYVKLGRNVHSESQQLQDPVMAHGSCGFMVSLPFPALLEELC